MPKEPVNRSNLQTLDDADAQSRQTLERILWIGVAGAAAVVVVNLALYFETRAWQMLVVVAGELMAIAGLSPIRREIRHGKFVQAVLWLDASICIAFGIPELVHAGGTLYFLMGGILMLLISGRMTLPRQPTVWLAYSVGFAVYVGLIELVNLIWRLPRYSIEQSIALGIAAPIIVGAISILVIWQLVRAYRRIQFIRTRLLFGSVVIVILPMIAIAAAVTWTNLNNAQDQAKRQLESVASLKEAELNTWLQNTRSSIALVASDQQATELIQPLLSEPAASANYKNAHDRLFSRLRQANQQMVLQQTQLFDELAVLDMRGRVLASTDPRQEGMDKREQVYFQQVLKGMYGESPFRSAGLEPGQVVASRPVVDLEGKPVAVLAGTISFTALRAIMTERAGLGKTAETYLVGENGAPLTSLRVAFNQPALQSQGIDLAIKQQVNGSKQYLNYRNVPVIGVYRWLPQLRIALLAEQEQSEAFAGTYQMLSILGGLAIVALLLAVAISLGITRSIATPLANLAQTAEQIASGDLTLTARIETRDEIGILAQAFNSMTAQLRHLINNLETQVKERTAQLNASAEVGRAASSILDVPALMTTVVNLITDRFGYYYAAVFMPDESGRYAVLQEGTGEAGRLLKAHGHQLEVGYTSMVGTVVATGQLRIAQQVENEAARFVNPLLPDTRSEIALPLRLGGVGSNARIVGALDVQSTQPGAFDEASAAVLQNMADQIAVALGNARLYTEIQQRAQEQEGLARIAALAGSTLNAETLLDRLLTEARQLFGAEMSAVLLRDDARHALVGRYIAAEGTPTLAPEAWNIPLDAPGFEHSIFARGGGYYSRQGSEDPQVIPAYRPYMEALHIRNFCGVALRARDQSLGELYVGNRPQGFGANEMSLLQTIAGYAANAIQNAQLFEELQRRAAREQTLSMISGRVRAWLTLDQMLQTTVQEIGQRLGAARVAVQLKMPEGNGDGNRTAQQAVGEVRVA